MVGSVRVLTVETAREDVGRVRKDVERIGEGVQRAGRMST